MSSAQVQSDDVSVPSNISVADVVNRSCCVRGFVLNCASKEGEDEECTLEAPEHRPMV
jgi:hypothetical protein